MVSKKEKKNLEKITNSNFFNRNR